ncbi:MAG: hypothetical protein ACAI44_02705 [Candidatus Sericytochromatia bacterium]
MKPFQKVAVVAAGYLVAVLLACAAVAIRMAMTSGPDAQASSGMYAFGDLLLFIAVFGVSVLVPTGAGLYFLKSNPGFWKVFSALGLALALTGVTAAVLFAIGKDAAAPSVLSTGAGFAVLRILVSPLFTLGFCLCAFFAPKGSPRFNFIAASIMEAVVSALVGFFWFVTLFFNR